MIGTKRLETRRLVLKDITEEDDEDIKKIEDNVNFLRQINEIDNACLTEEFFILAIKEKMSELFLGLVGAKKKKTEPDIMECFIGLLPEFEGNGYAIETLKCLFSYLFEYYNLTKIESYILPSNIKGWKAAERSGMKYKGQMTDNTMQKIMYFELTRENYQLFNHT